MFFSRLRFSIVLLLVCTGFSAQAQTAGSLPPNAEAGKCYAICDQSIYVDSIFYEKKTYPIYIGNDPKVKTKEIKLLEQLADQNYPAKYSIHTIPNKPKKVPSEDIYLRTFHIPYRIRDMHQNQWLEVICNNKLTEEIIQKLQFSLIKDGFDYLNPSGILDKPTKDALVSFQKAYALPIGALDLKTLKALGVK